MSPDTGLGLEEMKASVAGVPAHVASATETDTPSNLERDALRYRYLREHHSSHYPMSHESPAEWTICWDFQQLTPAEAYGTFDGWIDRDIAALDAEDRALLSSEALPISPSAASAGNLPPDELSNLRDETARIVDPEAWAEADRYAGTHKLTVDEVFPPANQWRCTQLSLAKADQIQALYVGLGRGLGASGADISAAGPAACAAGDAQRKSELSEPYRPVVIHYEESDALEYVERDVPTVAESVTPHLAVMRDMQTRQIIGFRLADWTYLSEHAQPDWPALNPVQVMKTEGGAS